MKNLSGCSRIANLHVLVGTELQIALQAGVITSYSIHYTKLYEALDDHVGVNSEQVMADPALEL